MSDPRIVLCMKWGTKYGPEYVNRLYGMVSRHLRGPFRFVCLTDNSMGVNPEVDCLPLPRMELAPGADRGWPKLSTFKAGLHGLKGTALFLDLDVVIVGDITPFFEQPGDFLIIKDWKRPWRPHAALPPITKALCSVCRKCIRARCSRSPKRCLARM